MCKPLRIVNNKILEFFYNQKEYSGMISNTEFLNLLLRFYRDNKHKEGVKNENNNNK